MKKFTFIALLMLIVCSMAKADDKYFFKVPTDKTTGWEIQDQGNTVMTPGKEYLEVKNNKNGGRMLNYFWNESAWSNVDVNSLPNSTYKFTMDLNMSTMANRGDMEFVLLPINACTSSDLRVSTHNYRWWNATDGEDYFFRWRVGVAPTAVNGDYTIYINENPTAKNDWTQTTEETLELSSQKTYKFAVSINTTAKTATYTISDADGNELKTGVHNYVCAENRAGICVFSMNGSSTHQLSNIGLSYAANGPFANEPTAELFSLLGEERDYYVNFNEGEILHWKQLGDATDAITGDTYTDGEEREIAYDQADEKTSFEAGEGEYLGHKIIYCTKSGNLELWTTLESDPTNESQHIVLPVTCEKIQMPKPVASITNVNEGYAKEYTLTADNSETLLKPTITIHWKKTEDGKTTEGDALTGEKINLSGKGSLEIYAWDGTNPTPAYTESEHVTVNNNVEYVTYSTTDYAWTKDVCEGTVPGFTKTEIVDAANKSHWDRIYSTQTYGYDADGNTDNNYDATKDYAWVKKGFGFYDMTKIGTSDAKWNAQVPSDIYTAFSPLVPATATNYTEGAWSIFPLEGIVYYATNITNLSLGVESKYVSDDANKPNFFIVHTRNGYDRPDKGDCNATTVCVAGENFNLYRYDTAICDVKVMTYKGFTPNTTGIKGVNAVETAAPSVKKMMTKNGLVIVKGNKVFSVAGAQIK